jgi:hypothetical protein
MIKHTRILLHIFNEIRLPKLGVQKHRGPVNMTRIIQARMRFCSPIPAIRHRGLQKNYWRTCKSLARVRWPGRPR